MEYRPNDNEQNEQVASGLISLKFNLTQKTIIAIFSSVSLFSSGFYAGFAHGQNLSKTSDPRLQITPDSSEPSQSSSNP